MSSLRDFLKCRQQIGTAFGCVPVTPITVFAGSKVIWDRIPDIITADNLIRNSGVPNILHWHIPVDTNLNVGSWMFHLFDYFDQQLPDLIEFGFPLDFDRSISLSSTLKIMLRL